MTAPDYDRSFHRLCHLAALTASGKVVGAIDALIVTTMTLDPTSGRNDASGLGAAVRDTFGLNLQSAEIRAGIGRLLTAGRIVNDGRAGEYKVAPAEASAVASRAESARQLEQDVRSEWLEDIRSNVRGLADHEDLDLLWESIQRVMGQAFRRHGAQTLQLLDAAIPGGPASPVSDFVADALRKVGWLDRDSGNAAIERFFNVQTERRTRYLVQLLDGTFTFFAVNLDQTTSEYLRRGLTSLQLFLDTNFIFGVLGLHQQHFADLSADLIRLIRDNGFPFELRYHERTLREIRNTINAIGASLRNKHWSQALSRAAHQYGTQTGNLSGLELAYHAANSHEAIDVDVYLSKFDHIEELLDGLSVRLYREPRDRGYSDEDRWRLVAEYTDFVKRERPTRPKPYETIDHDATVWLALQSLRRRSRSALETGAMLLSNDFLLQRFDWRELREQDEAGTVVTPSGLLQILRPFVMATAEFDERFVATFSIPEFRTAQADYGRTASRTLSYLATYGDVPRDTALRILTDETTMSRLHAQENDDDFGEIIESAILADNRSLLEEREAITAEFEAQRETARSSQQEITSLSADLESARVREVELSERLDQFADLEKSLAAQTRATQALEDQLAELKTAQAVASTRNRRVITIGALILLAVAVFLGPDLAGLAVLRDHPKRLALSVGSVLLLGCTAWAYLDRGHRREAIIGGVIVSALGIIQLL